ncbi:putative transmembrane protein [Enhygromyxa salina]|uniref:Putative transmembrane protein n=1 Tax=Enhygromyxa salina TaxID=215803 RepID=A0A0C1Z855_9BACT|nr:DUF924 family protein [Enhygromyxa salina]KIG13819.1 putative transmembrane protein [Enhygromyxa salina]
MTETEREQVETILRYWFGELDGPADIDRSKNALWWAGDPATDADIRARFGELVTQATRGALGHWADSPRGALALIILLDQFTRNLGRGTGDAYLGDAMALEVCEQAIAAGLDKQLRPIERSFMYMPMMHAEDVAVARRSLEVYTELSSDIAALGVEGYPDSRAHAVTHANIVLQFGRYPHRNELLGRTSSPEELAFMADGGPTFGQTKR